MHFSGTIYAKFQIDFAHGLCLNLKLRVQNIMYSLLWVNASFYMHAKFNKQLASECSQWYLYNIKL